MTQTLKQVTRLVDRSASGHVRPWEVHKVHNELLSRVYMEVDERKAERLSGCANYLGFLPLGEGRYKLERAWFCRVRLCPMCMWRRSLKTQAQMHEVMQAIERDGVPVAYVYLTLTVRNCSGDELSSTLDKLNQGWSRLSKTKRFDADVKGWYKATEITHNVKFGSPDFDTYHPHFHVVLAVRPSYFSGHGYIRQDEWTAMWRDAMRLDYDPIVDVRKVKGKTVKAVAEAAGYGVKAEEYIIPDDWDLSVDTVRLLDAVLANRRFIGFAGLFREYRQKLRLDDAENGDLVHINGDPLSPDTVNDKNVLGFSWVSGYRQYHQASD